MSSRVGRRTTILVGLAVGASAVAYATRGRGGQGEAHAAPEAHEVHEASSHEEHDSAVFEVTSPLRRDTDLTNDFVCQIRAIRHIELRALERGYLEEVFVDEGRSVTKGQPMFQTMPTIYQAELDRAKAEAEATRIEFENTKALADKQVVSTNELALAGAKLAKAAAEVALCDAHRRLTGIAAPFDGIMGLLHVRPGSLLDEGELLTTLSDNSSMWVYFNVTEGEYLHFKTRPEGPPTAAELFMANGQRFEEKGAIETIAADFNNETGTIAFRATFPNPRGLLRHGETGNIRLTTRLKGALLIPQKVTFEILDGRYVFVVDEQGLVKQRRVTIAHELPHLCVVSEGLSEGEHVVLEGLRRVQDGQTIKTKYEEPDEVLERLNVPAD